MLFALGLCENLGEPQTLRVEKTIFHAMRLCLWIDPKKKPQPFSAHAEVSPWIHRAQLLHCLQMFSLFFCLPEFSASHHQLSNPFFGGNCFDIKLKTSPAPQWCCRRGETGGAGGISWANEARGIWHLWAGCDRAPGGAERPLSGGPEKSLVAGCCWILGWLVV